MTFSNILVCFYHFQAIQFLSIANLVIFYPAIKSECPIASLPFHPNEWRPFYTHPYPLKNYKLSPVPKQPTCILFPQLSASGSRSQEVLKSNNLSYSFVSKVFQLPNLVRIPCKLYILKMQENKPPPARRLKIYIKFYCFFKTE